MITEWKKIVLFANGMAAYANKTKESIWNTTRTKKWIYQVCNKQGWYIKA